MQSLPRYDLDTVFDDRVLRRAFALAGGVPRIEIAADEGGVPSALSARLTAATRLPV